VVDGVFEKCEGMDGSGRAHVSRVAATRDCRADCHYDFVGQSPFGKMSGAIVIDADGHLVSIIYRSSYGEFEIERSSPSP
jgi:hypothetical protein